MFDADQLAAATRAVEQAMTAGQSPEAIARAALAAATSLPPAEFCPRCGSPVRSARQPIEDRGRRRRVCDDQWHTPPGAGYLARAAADEAAAAHRYAAIVLGDIRD